MRTKLEDFVNQRKDWDEKHIQLAQLYYLQTLIDISSANRSNTSKLVWWLVALPFILGGIFFFLAALGMAL